jgi:hypothetical protein
MIEKVYNDAKRALESLTECKSEQEIRRLNFALIMTTAYMQTGETYWDFIAEDERLPVLDLFKRIMNKGMDIMERIQTEEYDC